MAALDLGDTVLVIANGNLNSQRTMNSFWYRVTSITGAPSEEAAFNALHAVLTGAGGMLSKYLDCVPTNWVGYEVWYQSIAPIRQRKVALPWDVAGAGLSSALTSNVQGSITRVGDAAGRDAVGGIRVPIGTGTGVILNGMLTIAQKEKMSALATEMATVITTAGPDVTYTPMVTKPNPANPSAWFQVAGTIVQPTVRVLRRRTVGLGI